MPSTPTTAEDTLEALECEEVLLWLASFAVTSGGRQLFAAIASEGDTGDNDSGGSGSARLVEDRSRVVSARRARGVEALAAQRADHAPSLARCVDVVSLAASARKRMLEGMELISVAETFERVAELRRWSESHPRYSALAKTIAAAPHLPDLCSVIRTSIDARGDVKDEAHPELPKARSLVRKLEKQRRDRLDHIAEGMFQKGMLRQRQPVKRGDRLLLAVRAMQSSRRAGVVHDRSQSGDTLFVEPSAILELSNLVTEARFKLRRLIDQILQEICVAVLRAEPRLAEAQARLAEVDVAVAAARWAKEVNGDYAKAVPQERGMRLVDARHPLLLRTMPGEQVVPLTMQLGTGFDLLVVTGPNTGGKTLVLKTVGLSAWLSNHGLPIAAAEGSEIPDFSAVLADVGDAQSLQSSLSTFSGHLTRIRRILAHARPGTLVLLDELGTGTDPEEGAALGQAVLERLLKSGAWTIANTHLGQLKLFSLDVQRAENASMEFDPLTLAPQFRLLVGVPGASHAVEVAERLGLEEPLLERARELSSRGSGTDQLLADVGRVRREAEILRESASSEELRIQQRSRDLAGAEAASEQRRRLREGEAEQQFRDHFRSVEELLGGDGQSLLGRLPAAERSDVDDFIRKLRALLQDDILNQRWLGFVKSLKKGDRVYVPRLRERLMILKVERKRERVKVRHGSMEVVLPFRELTWVEPPLDE
jgi:DNA mismatch repair protein MutS2